HGGDRGVGLPASELRARRPPDQAPRAVSADGGPRAAAEPRDRQDRLPGARDRKSTRLNSSHVKISYAVFCLKKKKDRKSRYLFSSFIHSLFFFFFLPSA